ncbi:MAG: hypothetical protein AB1796_06430 [Bacillota bacterium]
MRAPNIFGTAGCTDAMAFDQQAAFEAGLGAGETRQARRTLGLITALGTALGIGGTIVVILAFPTSNGKVTVNNLQFEATELESKQLKGRLGKGGNRLLVKTSNGSIKINRL